MKYYVVSGELQKIVSANSPDEAAWQSLLKAEGETIDKIFYIDERGFRGPTDSTLENLLLPQHSCYYADLIKET